MPNAERNRGYYRVKSGDNWHIAYYIEDGYWYFPGISTSLRDHHLDAIDETPIDPNPPAPDDNLINQLKSSEIF